MSWWWKMAKCRHCDQELFFASMPSGKKLPCENPPMKTWRSGPDTVLVVNQNNQALLVPHGSTVRIFKEHWSSCPGADDARKPKGE